MIRIANVVGKMNSGGKKSLIMEYYRHIDRTKIQLDFICDSDSKDIPRDEIERYGGRIYLIKPYQNIVGNMYDLYKIFKKNNYKIVHAYNSTMNIFPLFVAKFVGIPIRISESLSMAHNGDWRTGIKNILKHTSKLCATHYMACGVECGIWQFGKKMYDDGKINIFKTVIDTKFNGYNQTLRFDTRRKFGWDDNIVIGHIGRFAPQKNTLYMLEIFNSILKKEPKAKLCLIGDGELKNDVLKKIDDLKIGNYVDYLGRREDIQQFYNAMDGFLLPSLYEGLPVVGLEAQSCGLPIFFSTNVPIESKACELAHFISLSESPEVWADIILSEVKKNIDNRKDCSKIVEESGFDSKNESIRLQNFYFDALNEFNNKMSND